MSLLTDAIFDLPTAAKAQFRTSLGTDPRVAVGRGDCGHGENLALKDVAVLRPSGIHYRDRSGRTFLACARRLARHSRENASPGLDGDNRRRLFPAKTAPQGAHDLQMLLAKHGLIPGVAGHANVLSQSQKMVERYRRK